MENTKNFEEMSLMERLENRLEAIDKCLANESLCKVEAIKRQFTTMRENLVRRIEEEKQKETV